MGYLDAKDQHERTYFMARAVMDEVKKVVKGKEECVEKALAAILAEGHILIECSWCRKDNACNCIFQSNGAREPQSAVYPGCASGGHPWIFHVSERNRSVCISSGDDHV